MAQQALQSGRTQTRGRAFFGLLDANGWGWASVKATFWFIVMIFMLGYIPDRAYYFTVNRTIDLGILAWSPINFCPPENETLPCPAPVGAVIPWEVAPPEISLPGPRVDGAIAQIGTKILYIGGSDGTARDRHDVRRDDVGRRQLRQVEPTGPKLPEAARRCGRRRSPAGSIFVVGGTGPDGKPTDTVYVLTPDAQTGELGEWQTAEDAKLDLDAARAARPARSSSRRPTGCFLVGGTADGTTPVKTVWKSTFDTSRRAPAVAAAGGALPRQSTDATGGDHRRLPVGLRRDRPRTARRRPSSAASSGRPRHRTTSRRTSRGSASPAARPTCRSRGRTPSGFAASGALYLVGGSDGDRARGASSTGRSRTRTATSPSGSTSTQSDLPARRRWPGAASVVLGPNVGPGRRRDAATARSPARPGRTSPRRRRSSSSASSARRCRRSRSTARSASSSAISTPTRVGIVNFVILLVIGWAFAHQEQVRGRCRELAHRRVARRAASDRSSRRSPSPGSGSPRRTGRPRAARR